MRHVQSVALRQHTKLETQVTQMLDPLHLVAAVVDEPLVEVGQLAPAPHHDVRLPVAFVEALDGACTAWFGEAISSYRE